MDDLPDDSNCEEEEVPEHFKETLESATGWVDPAPPSLSLQNIHQFFACREMRLQLVSHLRKDTGCFMYVMS